MDGIEEASERRQREWEEETEALRDCAIDRIAERTVTNIDAEAIGVIWDHFWSEDHESGFENVLTAALDLIDSLRRFTILRED